MKLKRKSKIILTSALALAVPITAITPSVLLTQKNDEKSNNEENIVLKSYDNPFLTLENTFDTLVNYISKQLSSENKIIFLKNAVIEKNKALSKLQTFIFPDNSFSYKLNRKDFTSTDLQRIRLSLVNLNTEFDQLLGILGGVLAAFAAAGTVVGIFTFGFGSIPFAVAGAAITGVEIAVGIAKASVDEAVNSIDVGSFNSSALKNDLENLLLQLNNASSSLQNALFLSWLVPDIGKAKNIVDSAINEVQNEINLLS